MKKTRMLVVTAAIILGIGSSVQAELPANSIMVGSNVYSSGYLTNPNNLAIVNDQLMNNLGLIYFVDGSGKAKDVFTGSIVEDSQLVEKVGSSLTYYTAKGTTQKIVTNADNEFTKPQDMNTDTFAIINVNYKPLTSGLNMYNVKVTQIAGISNAAYFKIGDSTIVPLTDIARYFGGATSGGSLLSIYASDGLTELANGYANIKQDSSIGGSENVSIILTPTATQDPTDKTTHGNTAINITNNGFATIDKSNKWIYYQNTGDKKKLYRKSVTGVEDYVISDDSVGFINVVGDWVYYSNYNDNGRIYRVRTDGTQRQKINDDMASCVNVIGDKIYYINNSDRGRIYIIDSQGRRQLISDSSKFLSVGDNFLFYVNTSDENKLYSYDLLSNRKSKISDVNTNFISAAGDYLIFYTGKDGKLYRSTNSFTMNPVPLPLITNMPQKGGKGSSDLKGVTDKATNICALNDNNIYYVSYVDGGKIYKLDNTGNGYKVVDSPADYINVVGDILYYTKLGKSYTVPRDADGSIKGIAVTKPKLNDKVVSVEPIDPFTTDDISTFNFPEKVPVIMSGGAMRLLVVSWDKTIPKPNKGVYNFTGTILGYGSKVTISVALDSGTLNADRDIVVTNEIGNKDTVKVTGDAAKLNPGDIVSVYNEYGDLKPIKTATVDKNGNVIVSGLNLNSDGGIIYVSITRKGKAEGGKIAVAAPAEAPTGFNVNAQDEKITGLKSGKQYKVYINDLSKDGSIPELPSDFISVTADDKGVVSVTGMKNKIIANKDNKQMLRLVAVGNKDSMPSASIEISKAKIPEYVSIDLGLGRILGTSAEMQYRYKDGEEWKDCTPGTTTISMTMSLEVQVKAKANGPVMESDIAKFGLFPIPEIKGIEDKKIYAVSSFPDVTWNENNSDSGITYSATLTKNGNSANLLSDTNGDGKINGIDLNSKIAENGNGDYVFTVIATKTDNNMTPSTATNSKSIKFTINSSVPGKAEVIMAEKGGTKPAAGDPETYYQATPTWKDLAGTYSEVVVQRLDKQVSDPNSTEWNSSAKVAFIRGNTITQPGYYKIAVKTTSKENGAINTVTKVFKVDTDSKAEAPDIAEVYAGGLYKKIDKITVKDKPNCVTKATIVRNGYSTVYTDAKLPGTEQSGGELTFEGKYELVLNTINVVNGSFVEKKIAFTIDVNTADNSSPSVDVSKVKPNNNATGDDTVVINDSIPYLSTIKIYDAQGKVLGSATNNDPEGPVTVTIVGGLPNNIDKIYVTRTDSGKEESNKTEVAINKVSIIKTVTPTVLTESDANDGSLKSADITIEILNAEFKDGIDEADTASHVNVTANKLPSGLTYKVIKLDKTHLRISITGKATAHDISKNVTDLTFTIESSALASIEGSTVQKMTTGNIAINFNDAPAAVQNVTAADIGNNNNGSDLQVTFDKAADESKVGSYRVIVVKNSKTLDDVAAANAVASGNYTVVQKTGSNLTVKLDSSAKDSDGTTITNGDYKVYVLSVADGVNANLNALSNPPVNVTLNAAAIAPTVASAATTDATHITLTMSSSLTGTLGDAAAFSVSGVASNPAVTAVAVSGTTVTLTLNNGITSADIPKVNYTASGTNDLTNGTKVANFTGQAVTNTVAPTVVSAETAGTNQIELTMSSALSGSNGNTAAFTINGAASNPTVTGVIVSGTKVTLTLDKAIAKGETITLTYAQKGTNDLTNGTTKVPNFISYTVINKN